MELPVETFELTEPGILGLPPSDLPAWGEAYRRVAANLRAYGLRNPLVISEVTLRILRAARARPADSPSVSPVERAAAELDRQFAAWIERVITEDLQTVQSRLTRGRLALWMSDAAHRWPECFLAEPPYPEAFIREMNRARVVIGPELARQGMTPAPIAFHPVTELAGDTLEHLARWPLLRLVTGLGILALLAALLFSLAR